jgi:hypothetical protein
VRIDKARSISAEDLVDSGAWQLNGWDQWLLIFTCCCSSLVEGVAPFELPHLLESVVASVLVFGWVLLV